MNNVIYVYPFGEGVFHTIKTILDSQISYDVVYCDQGIAEEKITHNTILAVDIDRASEYTVSYLKTFIHRGGTVLATSHFPEKVNKPLADKFSIVKI